MKLWLVDCAAATILLSLRFFVMEITLVRGQSMQPALKDGEWYFAWRWPVIRKNVSRYDIVICHFPHRYYHIPHRLRIKLRVPKRFVKRVIGLPGETVAIVDGHVTINDVLLEDDVFSGEMRRREMPPRQLGEDEYFVMGDNRDHSTDSRSVGPITARMIRGRVVRRIWPLKQKTERN